MLIDGGMFDSTRDTDLKEYEKIRQLLKVNLTSSLDRMKSGQWKKVVRRKIVLNKKENRELRVNCQGWVLAVLYDELSLFEELTRETDYLSSCQTKPLFVYSEEPELSQWVCHQLNYDMVWYCASRNRQVNEEVILRKLEVYEKVAQKAEIKNIRYLADAYLKASSAGADKDMAKIKKKNLARQKNRADTLREYAPGLAKNLTEYMSECNMCYEFGMAELFLMAGILRDEMECYQAESTKVASETEAVHKFQWYVSFACGIVHVHCQQLDSWFVNAEDMIRSFQPLMSLIWKLRNILGTRFQELLLMQWESFMQIRVKWKSQEQTMTGIELLGNFKQMNHIMTEKTWKFIEGIFEKFVVNYCREHPESIEDMVKRREYFPTIRILRFLSSQVCHGPVPVTIKYLEKRPWYIDSPFFDPFFEQEKKVEDVQIFQWIQVQKNGRKIMKLEKVFLQQLPEDVIRAAGMAGMFPASCMDLYIDFSRRYGRMELIPVLLEMAVTPDARKEEHL